MIRSRRTTVILAALAGLGSAYPSVELGGNAILAGARNSHTADGTRILASFLLPVVLLVAPVALLSRRGIRLLAVGVGLAGVVAGFILIYAGTQVMQAVLMQEVEYANTTGEPVFIYWAREGESLHRSIPLDPGEVYKPVTPTYRQGGWLRIVAVRPKGALGSKEYNDSLPWSLEPSDEDGLADRKLFDQTFTWAELQQRGNRVTITNNSGSP